MYILQALNRLQYFNPINESAREGQASTHDGQAHGAWDRFLNAVDIVYNVFPAIGFASVVLIVWSQMLQVPTITPVEAAREVCGWRR